MSNIFSTVLTPVLRHTAP